MPSRVVAPLMLCVGPWFTSLSVFGMISSLRTGKYRAFFFTGADLDNDWYFDTYGFLPQRMATTIPLLGGSLVVSVHQ